MLTTSLYRKLRDSFLAGEISDADMAKAARDYVGPFNDEVVMEGLRSVREGRKLHGENACARCGGAGGRSDWPGWACFDCGGTGSQVASR